MTEDRSGVLWIATQHGGLSKYVAGRVTTYRTSEGLPTDNIERIHADRQANIWLGTAVGLIRYDGARFTTFTVADGLPANHIRAIAADDAGRLWVGTDRGLACYAEGRFTTLTTRDGLPDDQVRDLLAARDGSLWVATLDGLARRRAGKMRVYTTDDGLPSNTVLRLHEGHGGQIWIGTPAGIASLTLKPAEQVVALDAHDGLSDNETRALLEDREGNLWVGTLTGGLNRLKKRQLTAYGREEGLPGDTVVPIAEDSEGSIWIGMTCGGLVRYRDGRFTTFAASDGLPNDCVWSLYPDPDGTLWIGTWGGGLTRRDRDGRFATYTAANSALPNDEVLAIFRDRRGSLWIGTTAGLVRFRDGEFTVFRQKDGLVHDDVRFITEDREGAIWIGTTSGASRYMGGTFTNYTTANGLSANFVRAIHQTDDGTMWFGTYGGGLDRLAHGRFTHITVRQGMFENVVSRILEDRHGNFWMTGNKGIARVRRAELDDLAHGRIASITSVAFGVGDGMTTSECNGGGQPAGWQGRDGRLWIPTARGVVMLDPQRIALSEVVPPVVIEQVLVDRVNRDMRAPIGVPAGPGALEIHYTGLSFTAPEYLRFRFRLTGFEGDWTDAGTRRTAYYSHLPAGDYTFQVMAANREGVWDESAVAALKFSVLPPFYQTWWFTPLLAAVAGGLLFVAHERRVRRLKRARIEQEAFSQQLIESQEADRKRIAAELHDSLSQTLVVIKNRALLSLQAPDDHEKALEQIDEIAAAATHAIDEVREISYNLRPYHLDRLGLTNAIDVMIDKVSSGQGPRFTRALDPLDGAFPKPAEINVYRIVQEGVTNIVKHSGASEASVTIERGPREVVITLRDNGCGFVRDGRRGSPAPGSIEGHGAAPSGFGLIGMAERARLLGGELVIDSTPGAGSTVRLTIGVSHSDGQ
jgi:signal transduction histidine kinase/ligand-binding sensor domain-containing protein